MSVRKNATGGRNGRARCIFRNRIIVRFSGLTTNTSCEGNVIRDLILCYFCYVSLGLSTIRYIHIYYERELEAITMESRMYRTRKADGLKTSVCKASLTCSIE